MMSEDEIPDKQFKKNQWTKEEKTCEDFFTLATSLFTRLQNMEPQGIVSHLELTALHDMMLLYREVLDNKLSIAIEGDAISIESGSIFGDVKILGDVKFQSYGASLKGNLEVSGALIIPSEDLEINNNTVNFEASNTTLSINGIMMPKQSWKDRRMGKQEEE